MIENRQQYENILDAAMYTYKHYVLYYRPPEDKCLENIISATNIRGILEIFSQKVAYKVANSNTISGPYVTKLRHVLD